VPSPTETVLATSLIRLKPQAGSRGEARQHGKPDNPTMRGGGMRNAGWDPLPEALMRTRMVDVVHVLREQSMEVSLTEDQQVVQAFTPHASHKPFTHSVRSGACTGVCRTVIPVASAIWSNMGPNLSSLSVSGSEGPRPTAWHSAAAVPPTRRRVTGNVEPDDLSGSQRHDEEGKDGAEEDIVSLQEIARPDLLTVIVQERRPPLAGRSWATCTAHIILHRALADMDREFEQLAPDALGSPEAILSNQPCDQVHHVRGQPRDVGWCSRLAPPQQAEP